MILAQVQRNYLNHCFKIHFHYYFKCASIDVSVQVCALECRGQRCQTLLQLELELELQEGVDCLGSELGTKPVFLQKQNNC